MSKENLALINWVTFIIIVVAINATIPFALGMNVQAWTQSYSKAILFGFVIYGLLFLFLPLLILKGWEVVRKPTFIVPIIMAIVAISLRKINPWIPTLSIVCLFYIHKKHDLSDFGIRSSGWKADIFAIIILVLIRFIPLLIQMRPPSQSIEYALMKGLDRMFGNPASTVENLFYFGFLTNQLSKKIGVWLTPLIIAGMYTLHEMSNPEYWYSNMNFIFTYFGVLFTASVYIWRKSVVVIWVSDGIGRFISSLWK